MSDTKTVDALAVLDARITHCHLIAKAFREKVSTEAAGGAEQWEAAELRASKARDAFAKLIDEAQRCCDGVGDLADLRAALRACGGAQ